MAVQLNIPYETLIDLVKQLPEEQQQDLLTRLLTQRARQRALTVEPTFRGSG